MQTQDYIEEPRVAPARTSGAGRRILWLVLTLAVVAGLVFAKMKYFPAPEAKGGKGAGGKGAAGKGGGAPKAGPALPVEVYVVKATNLSDAVAATGSVLAEEAVVIKSEVAGKITSLNLREGQPVRKGQVLVTINADDLQAALRKQQYNIKLYQDQEKRQRTLLDKEYISAQEYEQSNNQVLTARAELGALRATLAKSTIRSPFDGVLGLTTATVGTYVSPGTEITTLSKVKPVKIEFAVPGRFARLVKLQDPITITDEASNNKYKAKVYALDPQIDPVSRTQTVRARYPNTSNELRPGAFVKVNLELGQTEGALQVPTEAVVPEAAGYSVYTVKNGKMEPRKIKIGMRSDKLIQVTDGLSIGDSVIRTGILQVKPGDLVRVIK
ncbi:efflux RND transporter periplasmic adaptor subunit [Hymenobacter actinosclerus]|uniref:Membrane fusion protein, multidrug efflux system n=1 Tax=Hymenobacter actinosclerus TaxID=82805 RepID=A0A1I0GPI2_9BACT|nr:efflux RND transporter periplasmic adaptor subunit [Hymenobacter actinosclerus]SET72885.1 membrane fusion protein, multidrug efflux system [Hymenobacter actinosclerus]